LFKPFPPIPAEIFFVFSKFYPSHDRTNEIQRDPSHRVTRSLPVANFDNCHNTSEGQFTTVVNASHHPGKPLEK
jgi:hypothetical protein